MDATYTAPLVPHRSFTVACRTALASLGAIVVDVLRQGVRGHDFERMFSGAPGAQFAALPDSSKQRLLDRGFRS